MGVKLIGFVGLLLFGGFVVLMVGGVFVIMLRGSLQFVHRLRLFICAPPLAQLDQVRPILEKMADGHIAHRNALATLEVATNDLKRHDELLFACISVIEDDLKELRSQSDRIGADLNTLGGYVMLLEQRLAGLELRGASTH